MHVTRVTLTNFRNYPGSCADVSPGRTILIGENAQGKTNFLEAIELIATGKAARAQSELDLIKEGCDQMKVELSFTARGMEETIALVINRAGKEKRRTVEKQLKINGLTQSSTRGLRGRLVVVSFKSEDLYLLRGGPKYRRAWIDTILETLRPAYHGLMNNYQKVVTQRNRLLKMIADQGRLSSTDQDQLKVWDLQLAKFGGTIIRHRMELLSELLPSAEKFQQHISGQRETLNVEYRFSARESGIDQPEPEESQQLTLPLDQIRQADDRELAQSLLRILREKRGEEIARKQTVVGPHRDDIELTLNGKNAIDFASQGQQRSLVLALKLAELERVSQMLTEPPVLLLDDVLAELDLGRQGLLMSLVGDSMQTLITTTHVDGFRPEWLEGAQFLNVHNGTILPAAQTCTV